MNDGTRESPYKREDVLKLIADNGGKADWSGLSGKVFEYCIDLKGLHLEGVNLEGTDLNHADLTGAYMGRVRISNTTRLENVCWGNYILGEENKDESLPLAIDIYRRLKRWYAEHGIYDVAGKFYYREKEASRKVTPRLNDKVAGWLSWAFFGHGEGWKRILFWIVGFVLFFAFIDFCFGTLIPNTFLDCLYYSATSFIALGYGSWIEESWGFVKWVGVIETFLGFLMMTLLLVTFVRKWTR